MSETYDRGMKVRREVLGDTHVDRAEANKTDLDLPFQSLITEGAWGTVWASDAISRRERSMLTLALLAAMGNFKLAEIVFSWIADRKYEDGSYWCGFTCPDIITWPEDKITWTNAAALMAVDAINNLTPAGQLFSHEFWKSFGIELS